MNVPSVEQINACLPQTQCTRCGYPSCRDYAAAIAAGDAAINQCPPGGAEGITRLAAITGRPALPLNPDNGQEGPRSIAVIDEDWCIGCTLCLDACPTDAILGTNKHMHTVIEPYCTGCELCIPVCPVDCISLENASGTRTGWLAWSPEQAGLAQQRYEFHSLKRPISKGQSVKAHLNEAVQVAGKPPSAPPAEPAGDQPAGPSGPCAEALQAERKRAVIQAALERARARRGGLKSEVQHP